MIDPNQNVLVVDDDADLNELVGAYVRLAGFRYYSARDGISAIRQARELKPALVVLDVMLPDSDGFEICRQLKSEQDTAQIPIVMLSALDREEHRRRGCQCGAVAYLTKPFDPSRLMDTIRDHVMASRLVG